MSVSDFSIDNDALDPPGVGTPFAHVPWNVQSLEEAASRVEEILTSCFPSQCDLMEVCCRPESSLSQHVLGKGGTAYRVGLSNKMDLSTTCGRDRAREFASIVRPKWMWFSLPCGATSGIQNLNKGTPEKAEKLRQKVKKSRKMIRNGKILARDQIARGGHIGWEWPRTNDAWNFPEVKEFFRWLQKLGILHTAKLDGCQVGVVSQDTHEPMLKPWRIQTTSIHMCQVLSLRCPGDHKHVECSGHKRAFHSGQYPKKTCDLISGVIMDPGVCMLEGFPHHNDDEGDQVLVAESPPEDCPPWDEKELKRVKESIRKLHINFGHPTNKALMNCLKARGVDPKVVKLVSEHRCDDCQEVHLPNPHSKVTLHDTHVLWHTLQVDIGQFDFGDQTVHVMFTVDEASRFMVGHGLCRHPKDESRNCTSDEAILALERSWVQYHGLPNVIQCDPEGCYRGKLLEHWCAERGVELVPCPGEDHGQIGVVESLIRKVKEDARTLLRSQDLDPFVGILQVIGAHNHLDRVGGYAPSQWAGVDGRLFEGGNDIPYHASEAQVGTELRANLNLRVRAEEIYRKTQAALKISRALNAKPSRAQIFLPGDLVYYRRYKTPLSQVASHPGLDQPKVGLACWYGPARVLATETKSDFEPNSRKPGCTVWIVGAGRLKRCSPHQLIDIVRNVKEF